MKVVATSRLAQGSSASRRLRRAGKVPGIIYGSPGSPAAIEVEHNPLFHALRVEAFHASILDMELDGQSQPVLLRDIQWHPYKQQVLHIDFERIAPDRKIHMKVPLHFVNQENSPAVKLSAGIVGHVLNEVEISCLPAKLPEFITVDLGKLEAGKSMHLRDISFPEGVEPVLRAKENPVIVTVTLPVAEEIAPAETAKASAKPAGKSAKGKKRRVGRP
ncbi:MAG: 50S ribosomal protein L25/general stress protein Ctc [Betaproteobacteria bacterium]|nr:50S ribosomal protein L25/general stress protein Ctc [Betaproteobacteria bacterium]